MSLALGLYRAATLALEPAAPVLLRRRASRGKEDLDRLGERLGRASAHRPNGPLVWLHGVSVGETQSLLPLVSRLREERPDLSLLVTSGTVTSAALLAKRLPANVIHQYAPVDGPAAVRRFIAHWRPDMAVLVESELWPNLIAAAKASGAKLALVSARLTAARAGGWARRPAAARALLGQFDLILPQEDDTAARLRSFGVEPGPRLNLKLVGEALPYDKAELGRLRKLIANRPVVLAASTHPGEDALAADAAPPEALLIIAPRHPERGAEIAQAMASRGPVRVRSRAEVPAKDTAVYVADTLGELGLLFALADVVVLCGSLVPGIGGHNPLEPARQAAAIISGPHVEKNASLFEAMSRAGAIIISDDLTHDLGNLLEDKARRTALSGAAVAFAEAQASAFEAGWAALKPLLPA